MKNSILKDILAAINDSKPKTSAYDTTAEVVRVEGDTLWVHIPGGVDETPVKMTINATAGDTVRVRVSGGQAWIMGNDSAPPTDDTTANVAKHTAENAQRTAKTAKTTAETASRIAGNTAQHFWMTEEGSDTGAHISDVTQEEFLADPANSGGNLLARSNGIAIRDGLDELATFSRDGLSINSYDQHGIEAEVAFLGYGATSGSWTGEAPYYTLGIRTSNSTIGPVSFVEGYANIASGEASHAGGEMSEASGALSNAQGFGALAAYNVQTAIGMYNDNKSTSAFEIGNGGNDTSRSNAFTVDWSGNVDAAGDITDGSGNQLSNKLDNTFDTATGTVNSNITVSRATCRLLKIGNVVFITVAMGNITSSVNTNTNLFTIPAAYRPSSNVSLQGKINDSVGNFTVRSDGYVRQTLVSALTNCFCAGWYTV